MHGARAHGLSSHVTPPHRRGAPVPGQVSLCNAENAPQAEVRSTGNIPASVGSAARYTEDEAPQEGRTYDTLTINATIELRRWFTIGIGVLLALTIVLSFTTAIIRPDLVGDDFVKDLVQLSLGGLLTSGGLAVGFLFAK